MLHLATAYNSFYRDCYIIDDGEVNPSTTPFPNWPEPR